MADLLTLKEKKKHMQSIHLKEPSHFLILI